MNGCKSIWIKTFAKGSEWKCCLFFFFIPSAQLWHARPWLRSKTSSHVLIPLARSLFLQEEDQLENIQGQELSKVDN